MIERLEHKFPRLVKILADGGYRGTLGDWVAKKFGGMAKGVILDRTVAAEGVSFNYSHKKVR